jgi:GH25 family lysozyme M1 (1,4-beta-N-acetylmuramidase)
MITNLSKSRIQNLNCTIGLDCSKYQKDITWSKAKVAGIDFAIVKITEGSTYHEDNIYNVKARIMDAQKNKIKIGYYHFARPSDNPNPEQDALEEVQNVLGHIGYLPKAQLPLALDIEAYSTTNIWDNKVDHMNRFIQTFIDKLKERNIDVIIYSYKSFLDINSSPIFGQYPLWIAAYLNNPEVNLPVIPIGWNEWQIWQFTEKGQVNGYNGDIDLNIMKKEYFDLF